MSVELWVTGPIIQVTIHGQDPAITPAHLDAIIDTGASAICLDRKVAKRLGLTAINKKIMEMADGSQTKTIVYMAQMHISELGFHAWVEVLGIPMNRPSNRVLLGRSFLKNYLVTYNGVDEMFHFYSLPLPRYEEFDG